jgi:hypothetical protein
MNRIFIFAVIIFSAFSQQIEQSFSELKAARKAYEEAKFIYEAAVLMNRRASFDLDLKLLTVQMK